MNRKKCGFIAALVVLSAVAQDFDDTNFGKIPLEMVQMYEEQQYKRRNPEGYARMKADRKAYEAALAADPVFQEVAEYCRSERFRRSRYTKKYVGNSDGILSAMIRTNDEGAMLIGTRSAPDAKEKGHVGTSTAHLVRFDKSMNLLWDKKYSAKGYSDFEGNSVVQCDDGSFIIHVSAYVHPARLPVPWILKVDKSGDVLWDLFIPKNDIGRPAFSKIVLREDGSLFIDGGVQAKDETAYDWTGEISKHGKLLSAVVGKKVTR